MAAEYWVIVIVAVLVALGAGFLGGRMSAPGQRRVQAMEQERDAARREVEEVRAEVTRHFEDSARMFGKLASDYRTFFQQFARSAQNLGLSEGRARELLHQADPSLVGRQSAGATRPEAGGSAAAAATSAAGSDGDPPPAGSQAAGEAADAATAGRAAGTGAAEPEVAASSAAGEGAGAAGSPEPRGNGGGEDADATPTTPDTESEEDVDERPSRS